MRYGPPRPRRHRRPSSPRHLARQRRCAQLLFRRRPCALSRPARRALPRGRRRAGARCLMPNHAHLVLVPADDDGLRRALAPVHRRYAGIIHARRRRIGHFWQGRFGAVVMDEEQLLAALAYVALNPVRARLVERARDWRWSSTRAHLSGRDDGITALTPI